MMNSVNRSPTPSGRIRPDRRPPDDLRGVVVVVVSVVFHRFPTWEKTKTQKNKLLEHTQNLKMDGWFRERVRRAEFHVKSSKIFCNISVLIPPSLPTLSIFRPLSKSVLWLIQRKTPLFSRNQRIPKHLSLCVSSLLLLLMLVLLYNALVSNLSSFDVCSHLASWPLSRARGNPFVAGHLFSNVSRRRLGKVVHLRDREKEALGKIWNGTRPSTFWNREN